jgi:hypothetical protein
MIYVGPAYTYYEFQEQAGKRLTDQEWQQTLIDGKEPPRPEWVKDFQGAKVQRGL